MSHGSSPPTILAEKTRPCYPETRRAVCVPKRRSLVAKWQNVWDSDNENKGGSTEEETEKGECNIYVCMSMCAFLSVRVASIDAEDARVRVFK